jgi:hypothetical protein
MPELKTNGSAPADAADIADLFLDTGLGDGLTEAVLHSVPVGKPKDFFRTHPDPEYRRHAEVYTHKPQGSIDEQTYVIARSMRGLIDEARPCLLTTVIYRDGTLRLWPLKQPKEGEHDNDAWSTARNAAKKGLDKWVKLVWVRRAYSTREATNGYAPDPDWSKLPSYVDILRLAFGEHGIIRNKSHPIYRELFGAPAEKAADDVEELDI